MHKAFYELLHGCVLDTLVRTRFEIILGLKKSCKSNMEFYILHPEKSKVNVLHNHSPITKTADTLLLLIDLISSVVPFMSFFCQDPIQKFTQRRQGPGFLFVYFNASLCVLGQNT